MIRYVMNIAQKLAGVARSMQAGAPICHKKLFYDSPEGFNLPLASGNSAAGDCCLGSVR